VVGESQKRAEYKTAGGAGGKRRKSIQVRSKGRDCSFEGAEIIPGGGGRR